VSWKEGVEGSKDTDVIEFGIDLKDFYQSVEWDLLAVPAKKNQRFRADSKDP